MFKNFFAISLILSAAIGVLQAIPQSQTRKQLSEIFPDQQILSMILAPAGNAGGNVGGGVGGNVGAGVSYGFNGKK